MKGSSVYLDHINDQEAAALVVDGHLEDFLITPKGDQPAPGTIFRGIVDRQMKGQGGVTLRLGKYKGFLKQAKGLKPGQKMLVQVTGYAEDGKAVPITAKVLFKSRYAIVTPDAPGLNISRSIHDEDERDRLLEAANVEMDGCDFGLIIRSAANGVDLEDVSEDIAIMREQAEDVMGDDGTEEEMLLEGPTPHHLAWREWGQPDEVVTEEGCFESHNVMDVIEPLGEAYVPLGNGASMYVEPTRALVAVDVNTGTDMSLAAGLKANLAVARALPRALRCRGLGGQITLDLAPMPKKDRKMFEHSIRAAFRADSIDTAMVGWTPLGHYELQRKRERLPIEGV